MAGISDLELRGILQAARSDAMSANRANQLSADREKAMRYYLGDVSQDIASLDGRSQVVSTDVSDTIEGLMPVLMEVFAGGDETVKFEPVGPEDTQAAEQETDYVNHVFLQKNPGFLVLYTMIKDALLSKVGVVKVWWQEEERESRETYENLDDQQFQMLLSNPDIEIIEHTVKDAPEDDDSDRQEPEAGGHVGQQLR